MTESEPKPEIKKGLKNVYIDKTKSSFIDGKEGKLIYRGYNIHDLASKATFEEIVYLLVNGTLPSQTELKQIDSELRSNRKINKDILRLSLNRHYDIVISNLPYYLSSKILLLTHVKKTTFFIKAPSLLVINLIPT